MRDDVTPECLAAREALSALLDEEEPGLAGSWLTAHLVACAGCRDWYVAARDLRRRVRLMSVPAVPPLTARILAATSGPAPARGAHWRQARDVGSRAVAGVIGLVLLWLETPLLLFGKDPDSGVHPAHELGAFALPLTCCLLVAVVKPTWGHRLASIFTAVAVLLVLTAALDLAHGGRTTWSDEAPHLLWVTACLTLWVMPESTGSATNPGAPARSPAETPADNASDLRSSPADGATPVTPPWTAERLA